MPKIRFTGDDLRMAEAKRALYARVAALVGRPGSFRLSRIFRTRNTPNSLPAKTRTETWWRQSGMPAQSVYRNLPPRLDAGRRIERLFGYNPDHREVAIAMRAGGTDYVLFLSPAEAREMRINLLGQADKAEGKKPN